MHAPVYYYLLIKVHCSQDYRLWLQTMYSLFGTKWIKLFAGPMLGHAPIMQSTLLTESEVNKYHPTKVYINAW